MRWVVPAGVASGAWAFALSAHAPGCQFGSVGSQGSGGSAPDATGAGTDTGEGPGDGDATSGAATSAGTASATDGTGASDAPDASDGTLDATSTVDGSEGATDTGRPADCGDDNGGCDPNATCDDATGRIVCTCLPGWQARGASCVVDASLPTLRWDLECSGGGGCSGDFCPADDVASDQATLSGDPTVVYAVTLSFLGVVEEKRIDGGVNDGMWNDGGTPNVDDWNTVSLEISDPPHVYWLNDGSEGVTYTTLLDYDQTVPVRGGATVMLASIDTNQCITWNHDDAGDPIVVPGVPPFPQAHPGQFVQADVVSIVPR